MSKPRMIRDPVHGDIELTAVESAVIDTRIFQRLRYIRQNGLLHFVFPGAVHTRFMHSIGTLHVAGQVARQLLRELRNAAVAECERGAIDYLSAVFRLAALLHDVGHCAFSHSMESVKLDGEPTLGRGRERFRDWGAEKTLESCEEARLKLDDDADHELLGLALVEKLMLENRVVSAIEHEGWSADDLRCDVQCLMNGGLASSKVMDEHLEAFRGLYARSGRADDVPDFEKDILGIFHNLVSGTLDVDRLDYLARDSQFCGVPYGRCDAAMLIRSLRLGTISGDESPTYLDLVLTEKTVPAFEDFLWSRYQMFAQVYNHKTNVALNTVFSGAIEAAIDDDRFSPPKTLKDYLGFTDDYVMSQVIGSCLRGKLAETLYAKTLVDRRIPRYFGLVEGKKDDPRVIQHRDKLAAEQQVGKTEVLLGPAKSELKPGPVPMIEGARGFFLTMRDFRRAVVWTKQCAGIVTFSTQYR